MARTYFFKAEELWTELANDAPDYIEFKRSLEWVRDKLNSVGDSSFRSKLINFGHTLFK